MTHENMLFSPVSVVFSGVLLSIIILLGVIGNLVIVWIVQRSPRLKGKSHILIANLAVADALQSCNTFFMLVTVAHGGQWVFGHTACQINAFLTVEFVLASMLNLTVISINRYFKVVNPGRYDTLFTARSLRKIIAFTWIFPLIYAIPPLVGWSMYVFNPGKCLCLFRFRLNHSYALFLVGTITSPALLVICYTNYRIILAVRMHRNRISTLQQTRLCMDEFKITSVIAVVVSSYIVCYIPATVVNLIEIFTSDYEIPVWLDFSSFVLIFMSHANNPIIYGFMSKLYRSSLLELLPCKPRKVTVHNREYMLKIPQRLDLQCHMRPVLLVAPQALRELQQPTAYDHKTLS